MRDKERCASFSLQAPRVFVFVSISSGTKQVQLKRYRFMTLWMTERKQIGPIYEFVNSELKKGTCLSFLLKTYTDKHARLRMRSRQLKRSSHTTPLVFKYH